MGTNLTVIPQDEGVLVVPPSGKAEQSSGIARAAQGRPASGSRRFVRDIALFSAANAVALGINGLLAFFLPRYLSIADFGYYRLFILYASILGVVHLGLLDALLIRWSEYGDEVMNREAASACYFLTIEHLLLSVPALLIAGFYVPAGRIRAVVVALIIYAVVFNCATLGQFALQAQKRFAQLSWIAIATNGIIAALAVLEYRLGHFDAVIVVGTYVAVNAATGVAGWLLLSPGVGWKWPGLSALIRFGFAQISFGWRVCVAGLTITCVLALDRFFASGALSISDFALYAFAANALAMVNNLIVSVSRVVYPYLADQRSNESRSRAYSSGHVVLVALWAVGLITFFPLSFAVKALLPRYVGGLPIIRILMMNALFAGLIYVLQSNYLRVELRLNRLLGGSVAAAAVALGVMYWASRTGRMEAIAGGIGLALALWWVVNERLLRPITPGDAGAIARTLFVFSGCAALFWLCGRIHSNTIGAAIYGLTMPWILAAGYGGILRSQILPRARALRV